MRHLHFGSFGFDLGIVDQIVWKYSEFNTPITTVQFYPFTSLLTDHIELIYIALAPFYWIFSSAITLLLLQSGLIALSGIPVFWLAKRKGINPVLAVVIMVAYLSFYGIQNAIWFDVHSNVLAASFIPWFVYFLDKNNKIGTFIFFILAIISKENIALLTLLIAFVFLIKEKSKRAVLSSLIMIISIAYLALIFFVYFPHFTADGYRYANEGGLLSNMQISQLYDSPEKRDVYLYSLGWFSFLSLLSPIFLLPAIGDIIQYFVLGNNIDGAQGLFMHYRATLAFLLVWPLIITIARFKRLNNMYVATYLIIVVAILQYMLHVPLTYLTKSWFWTSPPSSNSIRSVISKVPDNASVVAQNNLVPHLSQRDEIFTLWPEKRNDNTNITCELETCEWFRWAGNPKYLVVDTADTWDIRHLLANREEFIKGVENLEANGYIRPLSKEGTSTLYQIEKHPKN
jgi:uncharacterized membrane protein